MPPRLQGACCIFCLTWLVSLAYWVAVWTFNYNYVVDNVGLSKVGLVMFVICVVTAVLAFLGCFLTFFDVTNFCCIILYGIPLAFLVPVICAYGLFEWSQVEPVTVDYIKEAVISHWNERGHAPHYLIQTEKDFSCCGIHGPSDYRNYIYGNKCESEVLDVPYSCCNLTHLFRGNHSGVHAFCDAAASEDIWCVTTSNNTNGSSINKSNTNCQNKTWTIAEKCELINSNTTIKKEYKQRIYTKGCLFYLNENTQSVTTFHLSFFIVFMVLSFLMLAIFLMGWCSSPEVAELAPHYTHSTTSQETLIKETVGKKRI